MAITYANFSEFTQVYSLQGVSQADISSQWLPWGAWYLNQRLGGFYTTPFSSNNQTARNLSIHGAYYGLMMRTRKDSDSFEIKRFLDQMITDITCGGMPMLTDSGESLDADKGGRFNAWSDRQDYNPTFTMLDPEYQTIDPDLFEDTWDERA